MLQTASNFVDSWETLLDAYQQIGEQLPLLQEYESLFHSSPHMIQVLELIYIDILDFHQQAMRYFSGKCKYTLQTRNQLLMRGCCSVAKVFPIHVEEL